MNLIIFKPLPVLIDICYQTKIAAPHPALRTPKLIDTFGLIKILASSTNKHVYTAFVSVLEECIFFKLGVFSTMASVYNAVSFVEILDSF